MLSALTFVVIPDLLETDEKYSSTCTYLRECFLNVSKIYRLILKEKEMINQFAAHPRKLFLTDALGALATALLLFFLVRNQNHYFGLGQPVVIALFVMALLIFSYSIFCYFTIQKRWKPFMIALAIANLLYCTITFWLVFLYSDATVPGFVYFSTEMIIIGFLVYIELKTASETDKPAAM